MGSEPEAEKHISGLPKSSSDLAANTGRGETVGGKLDSSFGTRKVAAGKRDTAAGIFDERADYKVSLRLVLQVNSP